MVAATTTDTHANTPKMGYLLDEARSDLGKLSVSISEWRQRSGGGAEGGGGGRRSPLGSPRRSPRASTPHATLSDAVAERDNFQVVANPSDKDVIAVGEEEKLILDDADKLAWLLDEARADLERTASTVTAEVVRTASTVSRKLTQTPASLIARAGSMRGSGGAGKGVLVSPTASGCANDGMTRGEEKKIDWLLAEAKADMTRAASTLSQSIAASRISSRASIASIRSKAVGATESDDCHSDSGDTKMAWLLEEARVDFVRTASRLSQRLAHENPASREAASVCGSVSTNASKKRGRTPSVQEQQAQEQQRGIDLAQEAREDLKKFADFLGLNEYPQYPSSSTPKEPELPKIIEIKSMDETLINHETTTLTYKREKSEKEIESEKNQEQTECKKSEEEEAEGEKTPEQPVALISADETLKTAEENIKSAEAAVLKAYIDDLVSPVDGRDRYAPAPVAPAPVAAADVAAYEELSSEQSTNKKAKMNADTEDVPPFVEEPRAEAVVAPDSDDDFVPITERDTYSDKGNDSDEWETMSDEFSGTVDTRGSYRPKASMKEVNKKVEDLLNTLKPDGVEEGGKKTPQEIADELIRKAQANIASKNAF
uniref:Uncharacterized protein n=1 Tax=Odontella aurita TaxID=265563 RepID=A0A7S4MYF0_9STRA|mmetsp:Transcript_40072/g.120799  ORF Transcript_40072/g.120799 Transcript_40072/m.120799 type:complete len:602 (+) Transcript_40072:589-2394(+)